MAECKFVKTFFVATLVFAKNLKKEQTNPFYKDKSLVIHCGYIPRISRVYQSLK